MSSFYIKILFLAIKGVGIFSSSIISNKSISIVRLKAVIGMSLFVRHKTLRFSELKKRIPDITEKMLSLQLKALEADGIIERNVYGDKPPIKVEYSMTEFGKGLIPVINAIAKWGRHLGDTEGELVDL